MGIDPGADVTFRANQLLLRSHRIHLENLTGLGEMPSTGGWIITGGVRIRAGSGSPATVFGLIPRSGLVFVTRISRFASRGPGFADPRWSPASRSRAAVADLIGATVSVLGMAPGIKLVFGIR